MSIVIAVVNHSDNSLYFYGDKRLTKTAEDGSKSFSDDFTKIFQLKDDLFIGVTGNADLGLQLIEKTRQILHIGNDEIIKILSEIDSVPVSKSVKLLVIIAGRNNNGELFIWSRDFNNEPIIKTTPLSKDFCSFAISISSTEGAFDLANTVLEFFLKTTGDCHLSIHNTIQAVVAMDETVSFSYDVFQFSNH